ncbi:hypothetical protein [Sphingomonas sp. MMS24-J13]|uniref:hypothetical protein n=1 Tax=Sphingomonas sp. MMS24-J13 TaxID=3238686 RepID=UPI00384F19AD
MTYHKSCVRDPEAITCSYTTDSVQFGGWLKVSAPSETAFAEVEEKIGIIDPKAQSDGAVPLKNLSVRVDEKVPLYCRRDGRGPQCPQINGS